ncbi:MAG: sensor histidine kinase [Thermoleophilia bacterium]
MDGNAHRHERRGPGGPLFGGPPGVRRPGGWKTLVFPGIWLVYLAQTVGGVADHSDGAAAVAGYAGVALFCAAYLYALAYARTSSARYWTAVGLMVVLTGIESLFAHEDAFVMCVFVAVLLMAGFVMHGRSREALASVALLTAVAAVTPALVPAWDTGIDWDMVITLPLVAMAMWAFFTIIRSHRELSQAREEVARLAAENERSRIARDLHDLLGHSLTTITVKAGLARRLAERDPDRAAREIGEVEGLARSALTDVRAAVAGYRDMNLAGELAGAREVLRAAGIEARAPSAVEVADPVHAELFGWVLREGVTNVVRHSGARTCTIAIGPTWLEIEDDGRGSGPGGDACGGSGLAGLRERVAAAGGTIRAGAGTSGWRLRVDMGRAVHA